jgi:hypothetical protein
MADSDGGRWLSWDEWIRRYEAVRVHEMGSDPDVFEMARLISEDPRAIPLDEDLGDE